MKGRVVAALATAWLAWAPIPAGAQTAAPDSASKAAPAQGFEPSVAEPRIAIGLAWDLDSLSLVPLSQGRVRGAATRPIGALERMTITRRHRGAVARVRGGHASWQVSLWPGDTLWLAPDEGLTRWKGRTWRGEMKVFVNARGRLTLATRLPLETYLLGVIPGEIGPLADGLLEAGRAQAMAARSFTLFYLGRRGVEGFDLFSTVEDQVYGPVESEKPLATRCVESTAGQVGLSQGTPIRANYSSTCGGITADVWEAWPQPGYPYLVGHRDAGGGADYCSQSPHYRWHEEWSAWEFLGDLRRFGPAFGVGLPAGGLGELQDVRVRSRSRSGRVWALEVTTDRGTVTIPGYSLRQVLRRPGNPDAILRSTLIKVGVRRDPATRRVLAVVVSGAGSGHGVGLCQTGALGMARAGIQGEEILRHYFSGIEIRRLY